MAVSAEERGEQAKHNSQQLEVSKKFQCHAILILTQLFCAGLSTTTHAWLASRAARLPPP